MSRISRLCAVVIAAIALESVLPANGVDAQRAWDVPVPPDPGASPPNPYSVASLRGLTSVAELEARKAVLTRRYRWFGLVGLLGSAVVFTAGGFVWVSYVPSDEEAYREGMVGFGRVLMVAAASTFAVSIPSLITVGRRRRTARRRINALLLPSASFSPHGNEGGATFQLTW